MSATDLAATARALVADGKGILAADESTPTIEKRLAGIGVEATEDARRGYRELLFTTGGIGEHVSGVIMFDETIRQSAADGTPFVKHLAEAGVMSGIKVDTGAKALAMAPGEKVTEGLDGLRGRLEEYVSLGARFTKWRAVIAIGDGIPSATCIEANAHALARFAALSQEAGLVPIVEPEVLMDGGHDIDACAAVTEKTLEHVFLAPVRAARRAGEDALEAEHGDLGQGLPGAGRGRSGGGGDDPGLSPRRPGRGAGGGVSLGRPVRSRGERQPQCAQRARGPSAVAAQLFLRPRAAAIGAQGVGRQGRQRRRRAGGAAPPRAHERCGADRELHRDPGERRRRRLGGPPGAQGAGAVTTGFGRPLLRAKTLPSITTATPRSETGVQVWSSNTLDMTSATIGTMTTT